MSDSQQQSTSSSTNNSNTATTQHYRQNSSGTFHLSTETQAQSEDVIFSAAASFDEGFKKFLENGYFSDVFIRTPMREYKAHKLILSHASEWFEQKLDELEKTKKEGTNVRDPTMLELNDQFSKDFAKILEYMYRGSIEFTSDNVIPLLSMADYYGINELKKSASDYIVVNITKENALSMLQKSLEFHAEEVINKCIQVIAKNFGPIVEPSGQQQYNSLVGNGSYNLFHFLPPRTLIKLTKRDNLSVANEIIVLRVICSYVNHHKQLGTITEQEVNDLFETVRFPFLSFEQLKAVETNLDVPRHLLTEALLERLKKHEGSKGMPGDTPEISNRNNNNNNSTTNLRDTSLNFNSRLKPRVAFAISLEFTNESDQNGVFHYISTKGGTEPWSNPAVRGRVRVSSSSVEKGNIAMIFDQVAREFWTMDVPSSWVMISLGSTRSLVPNCYTLRHGGHSKVDALRNWLLQGSNDGKNWVVLKRHVNDTSLNSAFAVASWPVKDCTQAFRQFRILQNGHNSSSNNFLSLSGFELYGDLYEKDILDGYVSP